MSSFLHEYLETELDEAFDRSIRLSLRAAHTASINCKRPETLDLANRTESSRTIESQESFLNEFPPEGSEHESEDEREDIFEQEEFTKLSKWRIGASMRYVEDEDTKLPLCWKIISSNIFNVRAGPNYAKTRKKEPSKASLYDLLACDYIRNIDANGDKFEHIASRIDLSILKRKIDDEATVTESPLPRFIICNFQLPYKPPKMMSKSEEDAGSSLVLYFAIKPDVARQSLDLKNADGSIRLLASFTERASIDPDVARLFKMIGMVENIAEVGVPTFLRGYNAKPVIIHKTGNLYFGNKDNDPTMNYMEIDIQVHNFRYYVRKMMWSIKDLIPKMKLRLGFVIQAEKEEDMPEVIFGCAGLTNVTYDDALPLEY